VEDIPDGHGLADRLLPPVAGPGGHAGPGAEPVLAEAAGPADGAADPRKFHQAQRAILDGLKQHAEQ
jgi:hypothetical protein